MRMARTSLGLALLTSTALLLSACGEEPPKTETVQETMFKSVEECKASVEMTDTDCDAAFKDAMEEHVKTAPKFDSRAACEAQYGEGKCGGEPVRTENGGSSYMPMLAGAMIGLGTAALAAHVINGMNQNNNQYQRPRPRPVYESSMADRRAGRSNYFSGGTSVATSMTNGRVTSTVTRPAPPRAPSSSFWGNSNSRTPTSGPSTATRPPTTSVVPKIAPSNNSWNTPKATPAPSAPSWSAPKVTPSPTVTTNRGGFGSSTVTRGGFGGGGGSRGGGGGSS